jgi:hypothetical protein
MVVMQTPEALDGDILGLRSVLHPCRRNKMIVGKIITRSLFFTSQL